ncbi:MAG TPA: MoaD/ThiS family protein [Firmicutes bacterium]|nr:MoaD/ThiS family protein [Bacillota bacterium]
MGNGIRLSLKYYNVVREKTGRPAEVLEVPSGSRWVDVLQSLCDRYGPEFRQLVMPRPGRLGSQMRVFRDGHILLDQHLAEEASEGAELALFCAISGG